MLELLCGNEYYCFLDGFLGFFHIPITLEDQEKITFTCPYGTFAYRQIPFGLCNAPAAFQRCMTAIFHDMVEDFMEVFMDDFSVFGNSFNCCLANLDRMLARCEETNLVLNWEKYHFIVNKGIILGHKFFGAGIEVDRAKIDVIAKLPYTTNVKGVRSFLGHAGFYRRTNWGHHSASISGRKVYESGFYWPRIFKDDKDYVMRCDSCQRSGNISSRSEMPQNNIQELPTRRYWMHHHLQLVYGKACHPAYGYQHKAMGMELYEKHPNLTTKEPRDGMTQGFREIKFQSKRQVEDIATNLVKYVMLSDDWEVDRYGNANIVIMEYLVKDSKRRAFWSLNEDILKITILKTNTPYPSRKIRRIHATMPALTKDHEGKKINTPYPEEVNTSY
ncbi:reverse transcriptase domain-containing protein [Tanacetum coccineum]